MNDDYQANTPVMKQFLDVKKKYDDCIVLFRMGDFYETFLEDAILTSKVLGIVLTKRSNGKASNVDLAGFPHHSLDNYLPKLIKAGHRVAICEQMEDSKLSKGIVKREVVEVVTPGTLMIDNAVNDKSSRYIGSIYPQNQNYGFSFLDSSTGDFYIGESSLVEFKDYFLKFLPTEVIVPTGQNHTTSNWYIEFQPFISQTDKWMFEYNSAINVLKKLFKIDSLKGFGCNEMNLGVCAAGALINHIQSNLSTQLNHVSKLIPLSNEGILGLDAFTINNLEIFKSLSNQGVEGTLIENIDLTLTAGGGRLLRNFLINPVTDLNLINKRLNMVDSFTKNKRVLKSVRATLKKVFDMQKILGKINKSKGSPKDLIALADTLEKIPVWKNLLEQTSERPIIKLSNSFINTKKIFKKIKAIIHNNAKNQINDGQTINWGVHKELDELRIVHRNNKDWIDKYEKALKEELDIPKLKISSNRVFGFYIELSKVNQDKVPADFIRKQTLVSSERFVTVRLKRYEEKILNAEENIYNIEKNLFKDLCQYIIKNTNSIQKNATIINRLDLFTSFATLAINNNYIKPEISNKSILDIKQGRHPVVENLLPITEKFIANDIKMDTSSSQIHLLTGPNMAGKSTYLRQLGIIVIMAQIGSFVPAKSAKIGIVDKLFTRVGASDNLAGGESTFMVEMNEAASILNNATGKSLILLDEIGRGTSTYDGLSLAWAITEYIHNNKNLKSRTVFATHYHELTDLELMLERLKNYHVEVQEFDDTIIFMRKITEGICDKSYGIHVAKMAGIPKAVVDRATKILDEYVNKTREYDNLPISKMNDKSHHTYDNKHDLVEKIRSLDIDSMAPLEALRFLHDTKEEIKI